MDIKSIQAFIAVEKVMHFGEAARNLNLTQPSLSARIKKLEEVLGFTLFVRSSSGVKLTEQGKLFGIEAAKLLRDWTDLETAADNIKSGRIKVLRIGVTDLSLFSRVTEIIRLWGQRNPDVKLELQVESSNMVESLVDRSGVDIGFFHPPSEYTHLSSETLFVSGSIVVLPDKHHLISGKTLNLGDLAKEKFILVKRSVGPYVYDRTISGCMSYGFSPNIVYEVDNSITMIGHVAAGLGIGLTIGSMSAMCLPGVKYIPLEPTSPLPFGLCWRAGFYDGVTNELIHIANSTEDVSLSARKHKAIIPQTVAGKVDNT